MSLGPLYVFLGEVSVHVLLHAKKKKLDQQLAPYKKINSRWIKVLNISCDTTKALKENISRKTSDIPHSKIFTDMSSRAKDIKERINKQDFIKINYILLIMLL